MALILFVTIYVCLKWYRTCWVAVLLKADSSKCLRVIEKKALGILTDKLRYDADVMSYC